MKNITLTQEDSVIFVKDNAEDAWNAAIQHVAEQQEKGINRGYSVAHAVILTPIKATSESLNAKVSKKPVIKAGTPIKVIV